MHNKSVMLIECEIHGRITWKVTGYLLKGVPVT